MADLYKVNKDAYFIVAISVEGFGSDMSWSSESQEVNINFFCEDQHKGYKTEPNVYTIHDDDSDKYVWDPTDDNKMYCYVDASKLDTGRLKALVRIDYKDTDTNWEVTYKIPVTTNIIITDELNALE